MVSMKVGQQQKSKKSDGAGWKERPKAIDCRKKRILLWSAATGTKLLNLTLWKVSPTQIITMDEVSTYLQSNQSSITW